MKASWLKKIPKEFLPLVQTFSSKKLKDWMPGKAVFKNVYEHNHTPVQMFMAENKDQNMPVIPDLVTFESLRRPKDDWEWFKTTDRCLRHFGGKENPEVYRPLALVHPIKGDFFN
ncbi:hypothetical protein ABW20_dc0103958 [Dactylellina cionopaga]|nr:hypothetical protein ABW20_dc0103958 [Dactylellina cionopaga]